ncbi:MAG: Asp-tRNA(Asn)/Glu-tRNA(Gln) amidotransferase subunit GatC [Bdellovibrionaceae bacterium]|nr:Asp-tRNA(Asn)/Glu-tRNA(Gln) amidotransferase subunit GatC [Bdellovibrionales bacterium]MCB9085404.1 Asp-tRNA(Asn)/Glu-tRNA(Gln) amidotransferase subunit GatC [Pseudobdellovibrionaceae bacterium]
MAIDRETITKIARLARLRLTEEEASAYEGQLSRVLEAFERISSVSTEGVLPMVTPIEIESELREDKIIVFEKNQEALSQAPELVGRLFKVPPVV